MDRLTKYILIALAVLLLAKFSPGFFVLISLLLRVVLGLVIFLGILTLPLLIVLGRGSMSFMKMKDSGKRKRPQRKKTSPKREAYSDEPIEEAQIVNPKEK